MVETVGRHEQRRDSYNEHDNTNTINTHYIEQWVISSSEYEMIHYANPYEFPRWLMGEKIRDNSILSRIMANSQTSHRVSMSKWNPSDHVFGWSIDSSRVLNHEIFSLCASHVDVFRSHGSTYMYIRDAGVIKSLMEFVFFRSEQRNVYLIDVGYVNKREVQLLIVK